MIFCTTCMDVPIFLFPRIKAKEHFMSDNRKLQKFNSIFEIYPDTNFKGAVVGYYNSEGTRLKFPCTLDVSNAKRNKKRRWTASRLGLSPVIAKDASDFLFEHEKEAWIGNGFFRKQKKVFPNDYLIAIRFLDNVTRIEENAFCKCTRLTEVTVPSSVTEIGEDAFYGCIDLTTVSLPDGITKITPQMFKGCENLEEIIVSKTNPLYASKNGVLFSKDTKTLIACPQGKVGEYSIPESVRIIGPGAFFNCSTLTEIKVPEGVVTIGFGAFEDCKKLKEITIPSGVKSIEAYTFAGCARLKTVTLPEGIKKIGDIAFDGCRILTSIKIPDSVTEIGWGAFRGCGALTNITIPEGIKSIQDSSFQGCKTLTSITIPSSVTSIGGYTFSGCNNLTEVTYGGTIEQWYALGCDMYYDPDITCSALESATNR